MAEWWLRSTISNTSVGRTLLLIAYKGNNATADRDTIIMFHSAYVYGAGL